MQVVGLSRRGPIVRFSVLPALPGTDALGAHALPVDRVEFLAEDRATAEKIAGLLRDQVVKGEEPRPAEEIDAFEERVESADDTLWVTPVLVTANIVVFAIVWAAGGGFFVPDVDVIRRFGADYGPLTMNGQWWRILTSMFLHFGVIHLAFNMWALAVGGRYVEFLFGKAAFLTIYFVAGVCSSLCSLLWHPAVTSAGASGAIFGAYGAMLGYFLRDDLHVSGEVVRRQRASLLAFVGYNLLNGLIHPQIDNAAHVGGLLSGLALGLLLARPLRAGP